MDFSHILEFNEPIYQQDMQKKIGPLPFKTRKLLPVKVDLRKKTGGGL
jgi:hypothetical protein